MPLHPQAQAIADLYAAVRKTPFENLSPVEARAVYNASQTASDEPVHEIREVDAGGIPCRLYRPSASKNLGLMVFFHGGGWVIGDLNSHDGVCRSLANKSGHAILSVDYRLAPEHKFPAAFDDCAAALKWAHANAAALGIDNSRIAVGGDSAGGNLTLALLLLTPLAATSFNAAIRAVGAQRWQRLHRLVYAVAGLAILHFFWMRAGKNDFAEVAVYAGILALLLGWRLRKLRPRPR